MVGHAWAVEMLIGALQSGRLAHAYLFTGPSHIGKTTLARTFAQALNCETGSPTPCLACRSCRLIARDKHPDVRLIEPMRSSSGRSVTPKIAQVRDLQRDLALSPYEGRFRVAILTRFQEASLGAANALLKTLEEPPKRVKLVLTADRVEALLPTIISRCQLLALRTLPPEKIAAALVLQWGATEEQANELAHISAGRLGVAVRLLSDSKLLEQRQERLAALETLLDGDRTARFQAADKMIRQKEVPETLELWLSWWRDVMLATVQDGPITNIDRTEGIQAAATRYGLETAATAVRAVQRTLWQIEHNANLRLAVEVLMLNLPQPR